ncbi:hypothetical protein DC28_10160 [Spirochaeta lutea]|uniref:Uncharacterized protein n=1 Tax=Spirochaeta lutea TaxID=1480694 RepID=A0A098QVL7_9SPIO|nr:hypothetical protein DC28_10160 [Spirochaeta lutea]
MYLYCRLGLNPGQFWAVPQEENGVQLRKNRTPIPAPAGSLVPPPQGECLRIDISPPNSHSKKTLKPDIYRRK